MAKKLFRYLKDLIDGKNIYLEYDLDDSADYGEDYIVLKQYPAAGTKVKEGTKVYLYRQ